MKFLIVAVLVFSGLALSAQTANQTASSFPPLDGVLLDSALLTKTLDQVMSTHHRDASAQEKELLRRLKEQNPDAGGSGFMWLSTTKDAIRVEPKQMKLLGETVGEVVIRAGGDGKIGQAMVSIFNRGDDGNLAAASLERMTESWKTKLTQALGGAPESRNQRGVVATTGWMWRKDRTAWLLEGSTSRGESGQQAEFLRLRIASLDAPAAGSNQPARRSSLAERVKKNEKGDVYLDTVPMVDQGQKGYCAVATAERVARYYGLEVDQHEMAQLANTDFGGTSQEAMEEAFKKVTGKLHLRTTKLYELDLRQFTSDVKTYNQEAKKAGEREFHYERKVSIVNPQYFWQEVKPELFRDMKVKQTGYGRFNGKIQEYIDQGIPLCWALQLGMFKETGLPQTSGGHMRIILGYNSMTQEILYSDSWGKGHELKRMPAGNAWCMTMALYSMAPTR